MDCIDEAQDKGKTLKALDFFSQIFCQKFEGNNLEAEQEEYDLKYNLGIYKMIHDIHDETYQTPMKVLETFKFTNWQERTEESVGSILWNVAFVISVICLAFYLMGMYFLYCDSIHWSYLYLTYSHTYLPIYPYHTI